MSKPQPGQTVLNDHSKEDDITRLLVGFANDLLAYSDRQSKHGNDILFIHDYVARRKKKFEQLIKTEAQAALNRHYYQLALECVGDDEVLDMGGSREAVDRHNDSYSRNGLRRQLRPQLKAAYGITDEEQS